MWNVLLAPELVHERMAQHERDVARAQLLRAAGAARQNPRFPPNRRVDLAHATLPRRCRRHAGTADEEVRHDGG